MKHIAALVVLLFAVAAFGDVTPPAVSAHQALDAAEQNIKDRGIGNQVYIESVSLRRDSMFGTGTETYWFVKWNHPIPATDPKKIEVGIKVRMDGRTTRLVKGIHEP